MTATSDTRRFGMHPALIYGIIRRQSGLLYRAVQELLSNSLDASATTCHVTFTPDGFVIEDNGTGFGDLENIEKFFGTFGTPHDEPDAHKKIARHRMGRGSIMAHASTVWTTGPHMMEVDIQNKGLDYRLTTNNPDQPGCRIVGTFYTRLPLSEFNTALKDIKKACEFIPLDIYLNEQPIRVRWDSIKWTHEDENCLYLARQGATLSLYNYGCYIADKTSHYTGISGLLISKKTLELNQARSEVVERECPVWKLIAPVLNRYAVKERKERQHTLSTPQRLHLLKSMVVDGDLADDPSYCLNAAVFPCAPTGWASLSQIDSALRNKDGVVLSDGSDLPLDEAITHSRSALVLSPELLQHFNQPSTNDLRDLIVRFAQALSALLPRYQQPEYATSSTSNWLSTSHFANQFNTEKSASPKRTSTPWSATPSIWLRP